MKIHMDYLEGKIEQLTARELDIMDQLEQVTGQYEVAQEKIKMMKDARGNESKEIQKKLEESRAKQ